MTTSLLSHYKSLGIEITASGDKLRLSGAESVLTPQIQVEIRNQRVRIFSELSIYSELLNNNSKPRLDGGSIGSPAIEQFRTFKNLPKSNTDTQKINLSPLEFYYPNHLPANICQWIMQSVIDAAETNQVIWWQQLEQWADKTADDLTPDDIAWKKTAYENIKAEWHRQTSIRLDFHMAKQIFGGRVLDGQRGTIGNVA